MQPHTLNPVDAASVARAVIVYDAGCGFCTKQMDRIKRWDPGDSYEYVSSHDADLLKRFPQLARQDLGSGLRVISPEGITHVGADAVYQIARRLPRWRWIAWVYRVPVFHSLCRWVYGRIAARRQRLSGSCATDFSAR